MKKALLLLLIFFALVAFGQKKKIYFPIWTFHHKNITIDGVSLGLLSSPDYFLNTDTNGVKMEILGGGLIFPYFKASPVAQDPDSFYFAQINPVSERINGINLSLFGTACDCVTYGIALGALQQFQYKVSGLSATLFNYSQIHNGAQFGIYNETYEMRGVQFGIYNRSKKTKGFQFGLWNVNERRKLPILNWNFK